MKNIFVNHKINLGKIFARHIADVVLLLLIAVIVFALVQFSMPREVNARQGDATLRYTIELGERFDGDIRRVITAGFHEGIRVGEPIFDSQRGLHIGTIVDVYAVPFTVEAFDEENNIIRQAVVEGLEFVHVVVEAPATVTLYETLIGAFPVAVGREAYVRAKHFAGIGYIVAMDFVN